MRRLLAALLSCLPACAPDTEPAAVAFIRQAEVRAFDGGVRRTGDSVGAHLGATLSSCPGGGYVAGAPGDDSVWLSPLAVRMGVMRPFVTEVTPFPVACLGTGTNLQVLVGGPSNAYAIKQDGGVQVSSIGVSSLDAFPGAYLAMGSPQPGVVVLHPSNNIRPSSPSYVTSPDVLGLGVSVAWAKTGALVVGNRAAHSASLYLPDLFATGTLQVLPLVLPNPFPVSTTSEFGAVVAAGNLYPGPEDEFVVAAPALGKVFIYSGTGLVATLTGGPSFGAALAVDPRDAGGGLQSLWVGEPNIDEVHRYFGDASETYTAPNNAVNSGFGQAVAIDSQGLLAIGAPRFSSNETGAVFETISSLPFLDGQALACLAGSACMLPSCNTGTCLGGVFCQRVWPPGSNCQANETCVGNVCLPSTGADGGGEAGIPDAGILDAGPPDAGTPDAGPPDAGTADAGAADAGTADAGAADAGTADAGTADAGAADAGAADAGAEDAGASDAGLEDAGLEDAGEADAGKPDAGGVKDGGDGPAKDAGTDAGQDETVVFSSCGCSTGDLPLLLLGLIFARRRHSPSAQ